MIGTIDVEIQAANPNMPLHPWRAYINSPSSLRLRNVPKRVGDWHITAVKIVAAYPDGEIKSAECVLTGGVWVGTIGGTATSGTSTNGYTIFADGKDENGNPVTGYVLGKGDITILNADGTLNPDAPSYYVHLFDARPETPHEGDMYPTAEGYVIFQGGEGVPLGITRTEMQDYVSAAIAGKLDKSEYHGAYIVDAIGNRINADMTGKKANGEYVWTVASNGQTLELTGTYNNASCYPANPEPDQMAVRLYITPGSSSEQGYDDFAIHTEYWREVDGEWQWVGDSGGTSGLIPIGGTHFSDEMWTADYSWKTTSIEDIKLATEDFSVENSGGVAKIKALSQADYDAITPDTATLYIIPEEEG